MKYNLLERVVKDITEFACKHGIQKVICLLILLNLIQEYPRN